MQVAANDFLLLLLCLLSHQKQARRGTLRRIEAVRAVASLLQRICDWREANITATWALGLSGRRRPGLALAHCSATKPKIFRKKKKKKEAWGKRGDDWAGVGS